ncbi:hypothetical protein EVA_16463 [gut metagenome]|uniref:Uncharacterized protein n=1 Tax=gut metagenome TaxID=749906 RepID=J9G7I0_9ZZZZ
MRIIFTYHRKTTLCMESIFSRFVHKEISKFEEILLVHLVELYLYGSSR